MIGIIFLISVFINGFIFQKLFFDNKSIGLVLIASFITGSLLGVNFIYVTTSFLTHQLANSVVIYFCFSFLVISYGVWKNLFLFSSVRFPTNKQWVAFTLILAFSIYIFTKSFQYIHSQFVIASHVYLDFGAHIPFIRSFSFGNNFPAEVPFFSGQGLLYHLFFDLYVGILEFLGLRIDIAFNTLSIISFVLLLLLIYSLGILLFKDARIGVLSVILFLFNSTLSSVSFLAHIGLNKQFVSALWHNSLYSSNGPLGLNTISVFWNLNTYLNQRHLIFGMLVSLFIIFVILRNNVIKMNQSIFLGLILGMLPLWHSSMFVSTIIILSGIAFLDVKVRKSAITTLIVGLLIAFPQFVLVRLHATIPVQFELGFLSSQALSLKGILIYWFSNLGFLLVSMLIGFLWASKANKKIFLAFFLVFLMANIFRLAPDIYDNHKYFNLWIIMADIFSAYTIVTLYRKRELFKMVALFLCIASIASGLIDFMVIKNDVYTKIPDYPNNSFMKWTKTYIPNNMSILTNGEIYDPLSLVGKKTFLGNAHYVYLYGGNPDKRLRDKFHMLTSDGWDEISTILAEQNIHYIVIYKNDFAKNTMHVNTSLFTKNAQKIYEDSYGTVFKI